MTMSHLDYDITVCEDEEVGGFFARVTLDVPAGGRVVWVTDVCSDWHEAEEFAEFTVDHYGIDGLGN